MTFGETLTKLRTCSGVTQEGLATAAGLPVATIRNYEQDRIAKVPFTAVVKLAKALGTDCTAFAGCEDAAGQAEEEPAPAVKKGGGK